MFSLNQRDVRRALVRDDVSSVWWSFSLSAVTAQSDYRTAGTSSSVPNTQCQAAAADPESVAYYQRGSWEGGGWGLIVRRMGVPALSQAAIMSAISVLEVQFDNSMQFLFESKIFLPPAFIFGVEELPTLPGKKGFVGEREGHLMKEAQMT